MLRNILRELFGTEFHSGTELVHVDFETKLAREDNNVVFPSGSEINMGDQMDSVAQNTANVEEMAIDIEFPDTVNSIEPIDTNALEKVGGTASWPKAEAGGGSWPKAGSGSAAWPKEPVIENNYEAKGQLIDLDASMKAYKIGSGSKMVVWAHDIFGLTGESSDKGRTKEWADFLAENGYNVLVPDWFRGNNMPGGTFGPSTPAWLTSVTNWTNIQSDWTNVIYPYLQNQSSSSIGLIGTCWGSYPVVRLSMLDTISAGVSMHPSHVKMLADAGEDEAQVLGLIKSPQLFLVEGGSSFPPVADSIKPGGLSEKVLGEKLTLVEFPEMAHGWTTRGDLAEPAVARDVQKAKDLVLEFFEKYLN